MSDRILVISRHFWPEHNRINDLCTGLSDLGYKIDVLCGQPSAASGDFYKGYNSFKVRRETWNKINIFRTFDVRRASGSNLSIFLNYVTFALAARAKTRRLSLNGYDAVLCYQDSSVMNCGAGLRIARRKDIPSFIYVANLWPQSLYAVIDVQSGLFRRILQRLSMHYYKQADALLVPSERLRGYFADRLAMTADRLPVVPRCPDPYFSEEIRDDSLLEKLAGSFNLLLFGDFSGQMSVNTLVQAAGLIRQDGIRGIRFVVTGTGEKIRQLRRETEEKGLSDYFYFEGFVPPEHTGRYLHTASAILAVVRPETAYDYTVPVEIIDYMAAGKPLIVTLSGLVKELVREADCGFTSEPDDVKTLYQNIVKLYRMGPPERQELGRNARAYQEAHHDPQAIAGQIFRILNGEETQQHTQEEGGIRKLWDI